MVEAAEESSRKHVVDVDGTINAASKYES